MTPNAVSVTCGVALAEGYSAPSETLAEIPRTLRGGLTRLTVRYVFITEIVHFYQVVPGHFLSWSSTVSVLYHDPKPFRTTLATVHLLVPLSRVRLDDAKSTPHSRRSFRPELLSNA
jgi:hypothetical protein